MPWDSPPLRASILLLLCAACPTSTHKPSVDADLHVGHYHDALPPAPFDATGLDIPAEVVAIAGQLEGAFLELECAGEEIEFQFCRPKDMGKRQLNLLFGGEQGKRYSVVLGVWGVVEGVTYKNGMKAGDHFYIGGLGDTPGTAEYGLVIGDTTYYLNHFEIGAGDHYTYGISYTTPPITIVGGSTLTLYVNSPDDLVNTNHMQSEADTPTPGLLRHLEAIKMERVPGQYVYIEVVSAGLAP
jgi:hypothetical protein